MNDRSLSISPSSSAPQKPAASPAAAARTKLLLEGPILPTLLRLAAPNILTLLAFAGVITFDGFFLGRIGTNALAGASLAFPWLMMVLQTTNSGMGAGVSSAIARALGAARPRRRPRLPRVSAGARYRGDLLHRAAAGRALHVPVDGWTRRNARRRAFLCQRSVGRRRRHLCEQSAGQYGARHRQHELPRGRVDRLRHRAHRHFARADLRLRTIAGA